MLEVLSTICSSAAAKQYINKTCLSTLEETIYLFFNKFHHHFIYVCARAYQAVGHVSLSENLACFVFL